MKLIAFLIESGFFLHYLDRRPDIEKSIMQKLNAWEKFVISARANSQANYNENQMDQEISGMALTEYTREETGILKLQHLINTFQDSEDLDQKTLIAQRMSNPIDWLLHIFGADQKEDLWFLVTYTSHELMAVCRTQSMGHWNGLEFMESMSLKLRVAPDQIEFYHGLYLLDEIFLYINQRYHSQDCSDAIDLLAKRALR